MILDFVIFVIYDGRTTAEVLFGIAPEYASPGSTTCAKA